MNKMNDLSKVGKSKHDGGPAFPQRSDNMTEDGPAFPGMSLRDWFAGMALSGISDSDYIGKKDQEIAERFAFLAYLEADAMLNEREK